MDQNFKVVYARISPEDHMDFRMHCVKTEQSMNIVVAKLIKSYLEKNIGKGVDIDC
jgi:hypothetical protein